MTAQPNFAELKGYTVLLMNYLHENRPETAKNLSYQWPVETMNVLSLPALMINTTSGVVWRRDVPNHLLRKEDRIKPWSNDDWAFIVVTKSEREERDERQRLIYPGVVEKWIVIEVFAEWQDAVREAVGNALSHVVTQPLLDGLRNIKDKPSRPD
ncbi:MAG: hypothetical protein QOE26_885 [Verrucomicrobiota bacterium]|jgi:hypothetical protein